ncbi:hypothetical protein EZV62_015074 [Acer yangbiense]|uniref:Kinetochore protein Nuf2 N-terminal domain-containing protein n=1 Tax=Acer yangbiense TaxID=1000413 RepID=A0A5C7HTU8_9ROSI|nr:hypothetical protein EZV62_015074 [Acer yangbiense]
MTLYSRIKEAVTSIGCPMNFTLKDLIRPDAARTEYFVSAILNFCLHKDKKMNLLRPIYEDLTDLDEQRKEWEAKMSKLDAEIAEYNEARERELALVEEVDAKVKDLRQNIQDLNKHQWALEEKKLGQEEAKNSERSAMQSFQNKNETLDVYTETLEKMLEHFAQMQAVCEQVNSAKSIEREYYALKSKVSDDGVLDKSLEAKLVQWQAKGRRRYLEARQRKVEAVVVEVDAITLKTMSTKEAGAAKLQALDNKVEEIVKQFHKLSWGLVLSVAEAKVA